MTIPAAARFKAYPAYKNSGVEWLGEIPAHWDEKALKRLASLRAGSAITAESIEEVGRFAVFGGNGIRGFTSSYTHEGNFPLIGRQGALCGCVNFASGRLWASEHAVVAAPKAAVDSRWLAYLLRAMALNRYSESAAQPGLAVDTVSALPVPAPHVSEQRAIATFLNRETAKIDALVATNERLIELLQEQRAAIIARAVTKGLDRGVPTKESRVESLGQDPDPRDIKKLSRLSNDRPRNGVSPAIGPTGETPTFSIAAVKDGLVDIDQHIKLATITEKEGRPFLVRKGDVLLLRGSGSRSFVGRAGIVNREPPTGCIYPDLLIRVRPAVMITPWFLVSSLNSTAIRPNSKPRPRRQRASGRSRETTYVTLRCRFRRLSSSGELRLTLPGGTQNSTLQSRLSAAPSTFWASSVTHSFPESSPARSTCGPRSRQGPEPRSDLRMTSIAARRYLNLGLKLLRTLGLIQSSFTRALALLGELGIARELTGKRRNRIFVYDRYLAILNQGTQPA